VTKTAKLLFIEMVIPPGNEASYSKLLDLMMLVGPGGCDRTETEYEALFQAGGFSLTKVVPTQSPASVIEVVAGIRVFFKPRIFAYFVAVWMLVIILNLLVIPGYFDVALRDLGLMLGALALGTLSDNFDRA
jgi:hypothetical protein